MMERCTPRVIAILIAAAAVWTGFAWTHPGPEPARRASPLAIEGKRVWLSKNCQACHQAFGLGGYLGPDLTNAMSRRGPVYVRSLLHEGRGVMPRLGLDDREVDALVEYLAYVDRTGRFPATGPKPDGFNN